MKPVALAFFATKAKALPNIASVAMATGLGLRGLRALFSILFLCISVLHMFATSKYVGMATENLILGDSY